MSKMNPYRSAQSMKVMWYRHLALTKAEAVTTLTEKYEKSVAVFDTIEKQALTMADDMASGIARQFKP